jgi:hypothetical protein
MALNFGRLVGWSVGTSVSRSGGSHTNVMLPLQFRHPGPPFRTLLRPAGHPQNGLKFWSVRQSVGHRKVTQMLRCLFSFVTRARPSRPFYALRATPKLALNFGWSVVRSVGLGEVTRRARCLFSFVTWFRPFRPFYALRVTPQTDLDFGRSVGRLVTGKSQERHAASSVSLSGPALPNPSRPCGPPPKRP